MGLQSLLLSAPGVLPRCLHLSFLIRSPVIGLGPTLILCQLNASTETIFPNEVTIRDEENETQSWKVSGLVEQQNLEQDTKSWAARSPLILQHYNATHREAVPLFVLVQCHGTMLDSMIDIILPLSKDILILTSGTYEYVIIRQRELRLQVELRVLRWLGASGSRL